MDWQSIIIKEIQFEFTRSGGAGGQHVNKTESAVILRFSLAKSKAFTEVQKSRLFYKLARRLTLAGELLIREENERDRLTNKKRAVERLIQVLTDALHVPTPRKKTKPTRSSQAKRLEGKKLQGQKKKLRLRGAYD